MRKQPVLRRKSMGTCQPHLGVTVLALIIRGIVVAGSSDQGPAIQVKHEQNNIILVCPVAEAHGWRKDGSDLSNGKNSTLSVDLAAGDPRGLYQCYSEKANASLQLYFRMCQYCVQLTWATVMGIVAAEVVATAFLVGAVWCLAAQEPSRLSRASDKQTLLTHDQLYQPLGERNNGQYSHIGVAKARRR